MRADVRRWLDTRTYAAASWPPADLLALKRDSGTTVSVVLPALNEERTVGEIVTTIREALVERCPLVDELLVVDGGSSDATAAVAAAARAEVVDVTTILPGCGSVLGKGEALWKSLHATSGDLVVFVDADLVDFDPCFVVGLLGPLLTDPAVGYVKALYDRPLTTAEGIVPSGGGRVTELLARPRRLLEAVPFVSGYGVEFGLLVDLAALAGVDALAQVDLGTRRHGHQSDAALGRMAGQILQTALGRLPGAQPEAVELLQFLRTVDGIEAVGWDVSVTERPPMQTVRTAWRPTGQQA
jgi:glucosyl-3-phosphoglycerate synthase